MAPERALASGAFLLDRLQTYGQIRAIDEDELRVQVVVSTGDVARDGMVIEQRGWVFDEYDRNPVVLWGHDDSEMPVARAIVSERVVTQNELIETHEFDSEDPRSRLLFSKIQRGFVNATSVRWDPVAWEWRKHDGDEVLVFTKQHLLESSYVSIPADPGALVVRADGESVDRESFRPEPDPIEEKRRIQMAELERLADALEGVIKPIKQENKHDDGRHNDR